MHSDNVFIDIENIIRINLCRRGMDKINFSGELQKAAYELFESDSVLIVTGFVIKDVLVGETDGPIGTVALAGALEQLGKKVVIVTDKYSENMLNNCCRIRGVKAPVEVFPYENPEEYSINLLKKYKPSLVAAIERPGRAKDGCCYTMSGEDISSIVPNTDFLFEMSKDIGITTLAVGDGGNEIGMGKAAFYIENYVHNGSKICADFSSDYLIIAGISNWGGHALVGALSIISNTKLLHDTVTEIKLMNGLVEVGAVDGITKKNEATVDGLSIHENIDVLVSIDSIVETELKI